MIVHKCYSQMEQKFVLEKKHLLYSSVTVSVSHIFFVELH